MIDNIKMLLGIVSTDTTKDAMINYWIAYYTKMILKYCHQIELGDDLQTILEQIVVEKMGGIGGGGEIEQQDASNIKSITRGDYSVSYDLNATNTLDTIAVKFQGQLNLYRRLDL
jgi:hypothetical protein